MGLKSKDICLYKNKGISKLSNDKDLMTILKGEVVEVNPQEVGVYGNGHPNEKVKAVRVIMQGYTPQNQEIMYYPLHLAKLLKIQF